MSDSYTNGGIADTPLFKGHHTVVANLTDCVGATIASAKTGELKAARNKIAKWQALTTAGKRVIEVAEITPLAAALILNEHFHENRTVSTNQLNAIEANLSEGLWEFNGESIKFDEDFKLIDGQHRLFVCVTSGQPLKTLIVTGLPNEAMRTIDGHRPRTAGTILSLDGHKYANSVAAAAGMLLGRVVCGTTNANGMVGKVSKLMVVNAVVTNEFPGLQSCVEFAQAHHVKKVVSVSWMSALLYYLRQRNRNAADEFVSKLYSGEELKKKDPIFRLRERLLERTTNKITRDEFFKLAFYAWNKWRAGTHVSTLRVPKDWPSLSR